MLLANLLRRLFPRRAEPDDPHALLDLATQRFNSADIAQARRLMDRHVRAAPRSAGARLRRAAMLPAVVQSDAEIDDVRQRFARELEELGDADLDPLGDPASEVGVLPFYLAYQGRDCRDLLQRFYRACARFYRPPDAHDEPARRARSGRRRVGFVSTFFHAHSVGRTTLGLIADLPREHFEVFTFPIAPHADPWARAIQERADGHCVLPLELDTARKAIRDAKLDALIFADLGMHPFTYFLAFSRLAPVQLTTWGHPVTSGVDTVDYYVSSPALETAGAGDRYSEKLLQLPGYFMPRYQKTLLEGGRRTRAELGLAEGKRLYCCPQSLFKLHPDFDATLRALLEQDGEGEVVLLEFSPGMAAALRDRLRRTLGRAAERVRFLAPLAQRDFHHLLATADVVLDPFHFGGCNSSCEALALGAPVVTLPGTWLAGRFTAALYAEMGLNECVASSAQDYVVRALRLARDSEYRRHVTSELLARNERLFQRPDAAQALGQALQQIVE